MSLFVAVPFYPLPSALYLVLRNVDANFLFAEECFPSDIKESGQAVDHAL